MSTLLTVICRPSPYIDRDSVVLLLFFEMAYFEVVQGAITMVVVALEGVSNVVVHPNTEPARVVSKLLTNNWQASFAVAAAAGTLSVVGGWVLGNGGGGDIKTGEDSVILCHRHGNLAEQILALIFIPQRLEGLTIVGVRELARDVASRAGARSYYMILMRWEGAENIDLHREYACKLPPHRSVKIVLLLLWHRAIFQR
ncbi:hypothetical protein B566_EDAN002752 [Ephemera danica]|nr:hypothetical protein B566_EDAN002752 [Ephemera danica]